MEFYCKWFLVVAMGPLLALPAGAQDEPIELEEQASPATAGPVPALLKVLENIVVTAQKRPSLLGDVPVSVTAISGGKLQDAGIENLTDLSEYTPNFKLVDSGLLPNIYMRGVGSGSNQGFELSVGVFADGIHLGRPHQTRAAFMDVSRVEVLRGPQSILFGKNAIAGALNIVSAKPTWHRESRFAASSSTLLDRSELSAMVSGPLAESLAGRVALRHRSEDGELFNVMQNRDEPGVDELAGRLMLDWTPTSTMAALFKLEYTTREQRGRTFQTTHPGSLTRCTGEDVTLDDRRVTDARELATIDAWNATVNIESPLGDGTLTSVSGYSGFDSSDLFDADSSSLDTLALLGVEDYDQFSQEIRFTSPLGRFIDYIVGGFYQAGDLHFYEFGPTKARAGALSDSPSCDNNLQVIAEADLERDFLIDSRAWSLFAQATLNFGLDFRTTFGLRYVREVKDGYRRFFIYESGTRNPADPATLFALDQLLINEHELDRSREIGSFLPSVIIQYDFSEAGMAYFNFTRGAKSGSYDARNNNGNMDAQGGATRFEFEDEVADALELGSKWDLARGAAQLNVALYSVDYQDMQVSVYDGTSGFTVTNAGKARTQGIEIDGRWRPFGALLLGGSLAFLDFEWLDYGDGPCHVNSTNQDPDSGTCDLTGQENQQTPPWTASLSGTYDWQFSRGLRLGLTLDANYRDTHFTSGDLDPRGQQAAHWRLNTRLAVAPSSGRWSLALLGRNLSDEQTLGIGAPTALDIGGYRVSTESRRTVLVEGRLSF